MTAAPLLRVRVDDAHREAEDVVSLRLSPVSGTLPIWKAGAHIDVHLPNGLVRQYSLCNHPSEENIYRIAVLLEPFSRGGSAAMHTLVRPGDELYISPPRNLFALSGAAPFYLLMAGGIGITPLISMADTLSARGSAFAMHYAVRSQARMAFRHRLATSPYAHQVHVYQSDASGHRRLNIRDVLHAAPTGTHLYLCGPQRFMDAVLETAGTLGWPSEHIHAERFTLQATPSRCGERAFDLELARSGRVIRVAPHQTVLQALMANGIDVPTSCEQGICGTCMTRVVSGVPDHRDQYLTLEEQAANDCFLPCCSRSLSPRLVLDL